MFLFCCAATSLAESLYTCSYDLFPYAIPGSTLELGQGFVHVLTHTLRTTTTKQFHIIWPLNSCLFRTVALAIGDGVRMHANQYSQAIAPAPARSSDHRLILLLCSFIDSLIVDCREVSRRKICTAVAASVGGLFPSVFGLRLCSVITFQAERSISQRSLLFSYKHTVVIKCFQRFLDVVLVGFRTSYTLKAQRCTLLA